MTATVETFREDFPEFGTSPGTGAYTDARITFWLEIAALMLNLCRWGTLIDHGTELFVAHHLAMDNANQRAAAAGGSIGQTTGPLNNKSVDKVAAGYSTGEVTLENAGHWNMTTYGIQFFQLMRMMGAGPIQI